MRAATRSDRDAVLALGIREEEAWFGAAESSLAEVGEWIDAVGGIASGVVLTGGDCDEEIRAPAAPGSHGGSLFLAEPGFVPEALDAILPWLREHGPVEVLTFAADRERTAALERRGLRHARSSFTLARSADASAPPSCGLPPGIELAPYALGDCDEAVHRLIYVDAGWASAPGHHHRDLEAWRETMGLGVRAFLARRGGVPVGWVASRILGNGRGYVAWLAVARDERRRGLGRALFLHGCADLLAAAAHDLSLNVVAANETALGLYRSAGFVVEREWRYYADPRRA